MSYFSRLTDIVTCSLTEILAKEENPVDALQSIILEMEEGLSGAQRAVQTAETNVQHFEKELAEHQERVDYWAAQARTHLEAGEENQARLALSRKYEVSDLIAGLKQQQEAALATQNHLKTTQRAIKARLQDAKRRLSDFQADADEAPNSSQGTAGSVSETITNERSQEIENELAMLRKELQGE